VQRVEHERDLLNPLSSRGRVVTEVGLANDRTLAAAASTNVEAMHSRSKYIYQAIFKVNGWRAIADFLEYIDRASG
jgi:hypothetical protein